MPKAIQVSTVCVSSSTPLILQDALSLAAHGTRRSPINYHMHPAGVTAFPAFDALSIDFRYFFVPTFASRSAGDRPIGA